MEDPVVAADGATYERRAIEEWLCNGGVFSVEKKCCGGLSR